MSDSLISKLPTKAISYHNAVLAEARKHYPEARANKIALAAVRAKLQPVGETLVARDDSFETFESVTYSFVGGESFVSRAEGDDVDEADFILASNDPVPNARGEPITFSEVALKRMSEQINSEGLVGRIDSDEKHAMYKQLLAQGLSPEEVEARLQAMDTGITASRAYVKDGKLFARIKLAKGVAKQASALRAASIEARYPSLALREGVTHQARLMGFVLTNSPADARAVRLS